jgi:hypothetical protein
MGAERVTLYHYAAWVKEVIISNSYFNYLNTEYKKLATATEY